eukprot:4907440-Pleurochrysis_carterae.AAC.1
MASNHAYLTESGMLRRAGRPLACCPVPARAVDDDDAFCDKLSNRSTVRGGCRRRDGHAHENIR